MKFKDLIEDAKFEYQERCPKCGIVLSVFTQEDYLPEYYTDVYVQCQCGEFVSFSLPVN